MWWWYLIAFLSGVFIGFGFAAFLVAVADEDGERR